METKTDPAQICPNAASQSSSPNRWLHRWLQPRVNNTSSSSLTRLTTSREKQLVSKQQEANDRRAAKLAVAARKQEQAVTQAVQDGIAQQLAGERKKITER